MQPYRPENRHFLTLEPETVRKSAGTDRIFQAMCIKCDEYHRLHVDLGTLKGIIPREEAALGKPREFAVLSRVGKPICFQVLRIDTDGTAILSRRAAQSEARSYIFSALSPGDVLPAVVQNPSSMGLFCDIGCGVTALMRIDRCCISRLSHSNLRYQAGQEIYGTLLELDDVTGHITLTGKELLGTWEENAAQFRPGQVVTGFVRSQMPYGLFIELTANLSGLAEPDSRVKVGDAVSVFIRSIQQERHKIKLNILEVLPPQASLPKTDFYITGGHISRWEYYPGSRNVTVF